MSDRSNPPVTPPPSAVKLLATAFFLFHAAAVVSCAIPVESALYKSIHPWFKTYLTATGNLQSWEMFHTIPYDHDYETWVETTDAYGDRQVIGATLPDLMDERSDVRVYKFFGSVLGSDYEIYREPYFDNLGQRIVRTDDDAEQFEFVRISHRIRSLGDIRSSGEISSPRRRSYGPFSIY